MATRVSDSITETVKLSSELSGFIEKCKLLPANIKMTGSDGLYHLLTELPERKTPPASLPLERCCRSPTNETDLQLFVQHNFRFVFHLVKNAIKHEEMRKDQTQTEL